MAHFYHILQPFSPSGSTLIRTRTKQGNYYWGKSSCNKCWTSYQDFSMTMDSDLSKMYPNIWFFTLILKKVALCIQIGRKHCQGDFSLNFLSFKTFHLTLNQFQKMKLLLYTCIKGQAPFVEEYPGLQTSTFCSNVCSSYCNSLSALVRPQGGIFTRGANPWGGFVWEHCQGDFSFNLLPFKTFHLNCYLLKLSI